MRSPLQNQPGAVSTLSNPLFQPLVHMPLETPKHNNLQEIFNEKKFLKIIANYDEFDLIPGPLFWGRESLSSIKISNDFKPKPKLPSFRVVNKTQQPKKDRI